MKELSLRSVPCPTAGGAATLADINRRVYRGQFLWAEARAAQSVFCDVHAAKKRILIDSRPPSRELCEAFKITSQEE